MESFFFVQCSRCEQDGRLTRNSSYYGSCVDGIPQRVPCTVERETIAWKCQCNTLYALILYRENESLRNSNDNQQLVRSVVWINCCCSKSFPSLYTPHNNNNNKNDSCFHFIWQITFFLMANLHAQKHPSHIIHHINLLVQHSVQPLNRI